MHTTFIDINAGVKSTSPFKRNSDKTVFIGNSNLTIDEVVSVARYGAMVQLTDNPDVLQGIQASCDYIQNAVESGQPIYGVTSGFGGMANVVISRECAALLQNNLMWYHKVGAGKKLPLSVVSTWDSRVCKSLETRLCPC